MSLQQQASSLSQTSTYNLLSDEELAKILAVTTDWVRSHASEIPGLQRLGSYYRFLIAPVADWLGGLEPLLDADQVAPRLKVPVSWVYSNAVQIPGYIRLGRYVRFRPSVFDRFISGSEAC